MPFCGLLSCQCCQKFSPQAGRGMTLKSKGAFLQMVPAFQLLFSLPKTSLDPRCPHGQGFEAVLLSFTAPRRSTSLFLIYSVPRCLV